MTSVNSELYARRERFVCQYRYLCARGARKFYRNGLDRSDLEQVAAIGLIKACDRYDAAQGTPFEAFAWVFVVGELMHHVRDHERMVRPPRRLKQLERRYQDAHEELVRELGCEPTRAQLRARLNIDGADMDEVARYRERAVPHSLDVVPAGELAAHSYGIDEHEDALVMDAALARLTELERTIVLAVYERGYSQVEIAERLGYSRRHISRLHRAALQKLKPMWALRSA